MMRNVITAGLGLEVAYIIQAGKSLALSSMTTIKLTIEGKIEFAENLATPLILVGDPQSYYARCSRRYASKKCFHCYQPTRTIVQSKLLQKLDTPLKSHTKILI